MSACNLPAFAVGSRRAGTFGIQMILRFSITGLHNFRTVTTTNRDCLCWALPFLRPMLAPSKLGNQKLNGPWRCRPIKSTRSCRTLCLRTDAFKLSVA